MATKPSLFNEYEAASAPGIILSGEVREALEPIISECESIGYPLHQVSEVVHGEVSCIISEHILQAAVSKIKENTKEHKECCKNCRYWDHEEGDKNGACRWFTNRQMTSPNFGCRAFNPSTSIVIK